MSRKTRHPHPTPSTIIYSSFRNLSGCQLSDDDIGDITECIAEVQTGGVLQDLYVDLESDPEMENPLSDFGKLRKSGKTARQLVSV